MLTTLRGRVEMDPMAVPLAASMAVGRDDRFEQVLQDTVAAPTTEATVSGERAEAAPAADPAPVDTPADEPRERAEPETRDDPTGAMDDPLATSHAAAPTTAEVTDHMRRGEPERQETAGKGPDSPRTSKPSVEPLLAAVMNHGHQAPAAPFVVAAASPGIAAVSGTRTAGETALRGGEVLAPRANAPLRAPGTTATYRTDNVAQAQLLDQARDSVFKQILMQLTGDGGEVRMRLEPPELGELDLRMVVEQGNKLSLTIAAERQDLQQLLEKHLDELKQTLQQAGLEVTSAHVQTRGEFAREQQQRQQSGQDGAEAAPTTTKPSATTDLRRAITIGGSGLDFWA
jgi:flagellar hook-length control protein FliK